MAVEKPSVFRVACGLLLFGAGLAAGIVARANADSPQRVELHRTDLTGALGMEVIASTAEYKPGESIEPHFHHGVEAAYVIQGAMVQMPGKEPMSILTGSSVMNLRDVRHGGFKVVGDTALKIYTVHVVDKGKPLYDDSN